jgi:hypothetical protein
VRLQDDGYFQAALVSLGAAKQAVGQLYEQMTNNFSLSDAAAAQLVATAKNKVDQAEVAAKRWGPAGGLQRPWPALPAGLKVGCFCTKQQLWPLSLVPGSLVAAVQATFAVFVMNSTQPSATFPTRFSTPARRRAPGPWTAKCSVQMSLKR